MSVRFDVLQRAQHAKQMHAEESRRAGSEKRSTLLDERKQNIERVDALKKRAIDEQQKAREDVGNGKLFGTIFGGPVVGTFIGGLIGGVLAGDNKDEKALLDRKAGEAENAGTKLKVASDDALEQADGAKDDAQLAAKLGDEIGREQRKRPTLLGD